VAVRFLGVADDQAARQLVAAVQDDDGRCFEAQRVTHGQPASKLARGRCGCRGHAALPGSSGRGSSGDGREAPAQLVELLRVELGLGFCVPPELARLERECLDSAKEPASSGRPLFGSGVRARPVNTSDPPFAGGRGSHAYARGSPRCLGRQVEGRLFLDDRGGGLTAVGGQEGHDGRREDDERADQECALVAVGRCLSQAVARAQD
jgi:hypothetical protein